MSRHQSCRCPQAHPGGDRIGSGPPMCCSPGQGTGRGTAPSDPATDVLDCTVAAFPRTLQIRLLVLLFERFPTGKLHCGEMSWTCLSFSTAVFC